MDPWLIKCTLADGCLTERSTDARDIHCGRWDRRGRGGDILWHFVQIQFTVIYHKQFVFVLRLINLSMTQWDGRWVTRWGSEGHVSCSVTRVQTRVTSAVTASTWTACLSWVWRSQEVPVLGMQCTSVLALITFLTLSILVSVTSML